MSNEKSYSVGEMCEAVYVLSKSAKQARDNSETAYTRGKHRVSKAYSTKKKVLYSLKARCLSYLYGEHTVCRIHVINNTQYYYLEFETDSSPSHDDSWTWKFHVPVFASAFQVNIEQQDLTVDILDEFTSESSVEQSDLSLQDAVDIIKSCDSISHESVVDPQQRMVINSTPDVQLWE